MISDRTLPRRRTQTGMNLIEIMVGMAIAMLASLVVVQAFSISESSRRSITGISDAQQSGNILARSLKRIVEDAGSGLNNPNGIWGCGLEAQMSDSSGTALILSPNNTALPAPFNFIPISPMRVAPAIAINGGSTNSDALVLMSASPNQSSRDFAGQYDSISQKIVFATKTDPAVGIRQRDWLLTYPSIKAGEVNVPPCHRVGVDGSFSPSPATVVLPGIGARRTGEPTDVLLNPGNGVPPASADPNQTMTFLVRQLGLNPSFMAIALDDKDGRLLMLNLMDPSRTQQVIAENVVAFRVLYGVSSKGNVLTAIDLPQNVDQWIRPTGIWAPNVLLDGTIANAQRLGNILALRIGVVFRGSQVATAEAATKSVTLFDDVNPITLNMTGDDLRFQHHVVDLTVPLRNVRNLSTQ